MKINRNLILPAILAVIAISAFRCNNTPDEFTIAFYNIENLFDTIDQEGVRDSEFTPDGPINWNEEKYNKKLRDLARVITAIDSDLPVLIGIAETENRQVLEDLTQKTMLGSVDYGIVHYESPDERGIDVALLYRKSYFTPVFSKAYELQFKFDPDDRTRDMLYVKGISPLKDTLHVMVDHWPSRSGGKEASDPKRQAAAGSVKKVVDSIFLVNAEASILIMGDLNDNPTDKSVYEILGAVEPVEDIQSDQLYNLSIGPFKQGKGTLYWRSWDLFDQIIVSGSLLKGTEKYRLDPKQLRILKKDWMLYERSDGTKVPNRTAGRREYYGGFSDHLPVYVRFQKEIKK